jgi:hypothetical protein
VVGTGNEISPALVSGTVVNGAGLEAGKNGEEKGEACAGEEGVWGDSTETGVVLGVGAMEEDGGCRKGNRTGGEEESDLDGEIAVRGVSGAEEVELGVRRTELGLELVEVGVGFEGVETGISPFPIVANVVDEVVVEVVEVVDVEVDVDVVVVEVDVEVDEGIEAAKDPAVEGESRCSSGSSRRGPREDEAIGLPQMLLRPPVPVGVTWGVPVGVSALTGVPPSDGFGDLSGAIKCGGFSFIGIRWCLRKTPFLWISLLQSLQKFTSHLKQ